VSTTAGNGRYGTAGGDEVQLWAQSARPRWIGSKAPEGGVAGFPGTAGETYTSRALRGATVRVQSADGGSLALCESGGARVSGQIVATNRAMMFMHFGASPRTIPVRSMPVPKSAVAG